MKILNFGSLNFDYVYDVEHIVQAGETIAAGEMNTFLGGKGFNQSVALAKAGVPVYHAGMVGKDGVAFLQYCREYGIDSSYIGVSEEKSGHTIIQLDRNAQNCILIYGGSNRRIDEAYVDSVLENFGRGDYLLLQNEISCLSYIIDSAYKRGMYIVLNPSPMDENLLECDLTKVSCFILNEIEGKQMTGETDPEKILEQLLQKYPAACFVLTLGSEGSVYRDCGQCLKQGIFETKAVDTTAAGDTFTGYFVAALYREEEIRAALELSACAAAIAVSRKGAAPSIPAYEEVKSKLQEEEPEWEKKDSLICC